MIPTGGNMRKLALLVAATAILSAGVLLPTKADAGCYRLGETGPLLVSVAYLAHSAPVPTNVRFTPESGHA
jgi:hypothetical protein